MPFFSIVIPTYNRADLLSRCIDSIIEQTFSDFEIIIIDNYSNDETKELVEQYKSRDTRIKFIQEHNNGIIAHSRNVGVKEAVGEYIAFLDSDDWFGRNKLEVVFQIICKEHSDLLYHKMFRASSTGIKGVLGKGLRTKNKFEELLIKGNIICNSSVCVRKSVLLTIGGISEDNRLRTAEDADCWLRIAEQGFTIRFIDISLGYYWVGDNSSSDISTLKQREYLYSIHIGSVSNNRKKQVVHTLHYIRGLRYYEARMKRDAIVSFIKSIPLYSISKTIKAFIMLLRSLFI